jgi:hypothetical protein
MLSEIEWTARIFQPGEPWQDLSPYGLAGTVNGIRKAVRFSVISPEMIMQGANVIENAIRLQLEAAETDGKCLPTRG